MPYVFSPLWGNCSSPLDDAMGVRSLWEVANPVARPVMLESLKNKRLAVDASIWIYQFLKAVRDSEGNVLKSAHVIGFFRRICKLLYFGIKPVFVFDGAAPVLKKQTITRRRMRREGKHRDATQTAAKRILAMQLQKLGSTNGPGPKKDGKKRKGVSDGGQGDLPGNVIYYDERHLAPAEQQSLVSTRRFRAEDQYHLPETQVNKVLESDPRLMTDEELAEYAREFGSQLSTGLYDTSVVDFDSEEFAALPITTQYQLLNTARLRSRLRMGQTADQLNEMFPNRMDFSKFQIQRVAQRNYLTQRILGLVGLGEDLTRRVAGEKGREYVLHKGENGYTLALSSDPIDVDKDDSRKLADAPAAVKLEETLSDDEEDDDGDFEDVPLNSTVVPKAAHGQLSMPNMAGSLVFKRGDHLDEASETEPLPIAPSSTSSKPVVSKNNSSILFTKGAPPKEPTGLEAFDSLETKLQRQKFFDKEKVNLSWGSSLLFTQDESESSVQKAETKESTEDKKEAPLPPWFNKDRNLEEEVSALDAGVSDNEETEIMSYSEAQRLLKRRRESSSEPTSLDEPEVVDLTTEEAVDDKLPKDAPDVAIESPPVVEGEHIDIDEEIAHSESLNVADQDLTVEVEQAIQNDDVVREVEQVEEMNAADKELAEEDARFEELEEEELQANLVLEAEQNEQFVQQLNKDRPQIKSHEEYAREIRNLQLQQNKEARDADEVTQTMVNECQELLRWFGIPYITAPMEAEAQCATLYELKLVDGIVTDDSDCFLFGGSMVYKNMFNQSKFVECYNAKDLQQEFDLDREKLIRLAHLLGSDYTDGLPGVGLVTALELIAEFNSENGLTDFKEWWNKVQTQVDSESTLCDTKFKKQFRKRFMSKLVLNDSFPDPKVTDAYLHPVVDSDRTQFEWGQPDLDQLRTFLGSITGWGQDKIDELLVPVIQNINKQKHAPMSMLQTTIQTLPARKQLEITGSKRVRSAVESLISQADARKKQKSTQRD